MRFKTAISIGLLVCLYFGAGCNNASQQQGAPDQTENNRQKAQAQNSPAKAEDILTTKKLRNLPALSETDTVTPTGQIHEYKLEAKPARWKLVSGVETDAYTYNGTVPGPTIRAKEGDTIRVILKNSLSDETSIHWHGLHVPNAMDGVPAFTQQAIKPGETFTYEFTANHAGTYMYHPHFNSIEQIDKGMYGLLIIDPQNPETIKYDREYSMIFGGWNIPDQTTAPQNGQENSMPDMADMPGMSKGTPGPIKQKGNVRKMIKQGLKDKASDQGMDMPSEEPGDNAGSTVMGMNYNYWTINGKSFPDTSPLNVKFGDVVRIRMANISNGIHPMHLHGHDFRVVAQDGHPFANPQILNTLTVNPGETYDVDFIADNPGEWVFHCHELHHTTNADVEPGGLMALIKYEKQ
ncbi:multicopper oxidase family protein [Cohnella algarum]|uniref:multicopper oxidase family protein n=1 Tax=Cohnella algarum TaxID=2044859 RepID=UPI0019673847|nr:multicopper oxidase family protein [Cohnella algarum]MBN2981766.1 multicopper oxidase family protein [Cohnella algarum]